ncbi:MAG: glycerate kinase [Bacteroidales bacterium]|nr:glycerate kinase [Bacteroidales bacterium]
MKILISSDSFKDSLSAKEVGEHCAKGIRKVYPDAEIKILPVADGGEGTVRSLTDALGGEIVNTEVFDPLMRKIKSFYGVTRDKNTAIIEMAAASGLELLKKEERNPWITTSYGTGELIKDALKRGCRKIIIGIGGSATNDGGAGMIQALGAKLENKKGNQILPGGGHLGDIEKIEYSEIRNLIKDCEIVVASDVTNPLLGEHGATYVYGAQKGADHEQQKSLELNMTHYAKKIEECTGMDVRNTPGAGAAGGLGAGLIAFLNARLQPGFEIVKELIYLEEHILWADLVVTGEGKIDYQTRFGKAPSGVARIAQRKGKPVLAIAGTLGEGYHELYHEGFTCILPIIERPMVLEEAIKATPELIQNTMERTFRLLKLGGTLF